MNTILAYISLVAGLYFIIFSFLMNTENIRSAMFFQILPFFLGVGNIFVALNLFNIITIVK